MPKDKKNIVSTLELQHDVEQFLFREARTLDEGQYDDWLELLTDDIRYWAPVRETTNDVDSDLRGPQEMALFDDDILFLRARVQRLHSGLAHAETPRSRTRRFLTNFEIIKATAENVEVFCNFMIYQTRLEKTEAVYVGKRKDVLKRSGKTWKIQKRFIFLDQTLLPRTVSILL